jgi:hypothetical protein
LYQITVWVDESDQYENRFTEVANSDGTISHTKVRGEVYVVGTPQDAAHFNNMEGGILDAHAAVGLLINALRQQGWRVESLESRSDELEQHQVAITGSVTLTNSLKFPFNNSQKSVALSHALENANYDVVILSVTATGNPGEIEVTDRQTNGFKMAFTGSASSVTVTYAVIGGYNQ